MAGVALLSQASSTPSSLLDVRASITNNLIWRRLSESASGAEVVCDDPDWASLLRLDMQDGRQLAYKQWPSTRARLEGQQLVAEYVGSCLAHDMGWHPLLATSVATASDGASHVCSLMSFAGQSLADFIRSDAWRATPVAGRVPLTLEMLACVMTALDLLHQRGYLHRDVKPLNVLYCRRSGLFRLIDLGLLCRCDLSDFRPGFSREYLPVEFTAEFTPPAAAAGDGGDIGCDAAHAAGSGSGGGFCASSDQGMQSVTSAKLDVFLAFLTAFEMLQGDLEELPDANYYDVWLGHEAFLESYRDFFDGLSEDSFLLAGLPQAVRRLLLLGLAVDPARRPSAGEVLALPVMAAAVGSVRDRVAAAAPSWAAEQEQLRAFGLQLQAQVEAEGQPGIHVFVADRRKLKM